MSPTALVAPDSFKGSFAAAEVAAAIARGLRVAGLEAVEMPLADGGEGTMDVLLEAFGGERRTATVADPLSRPVEAEFGLIHDGRTAIVEAAQASGLDRVDEGERDAWAATTRGTGELIAAAAEAGAETVIVTVGGSATTDGGMGRWRHSTRLAPIRASRCSATCKPPSRTPPGCSAPRRERSRRPSSV